ncbi:hypothetical protein LTR48_002575 [Friedmanniomyces endolithicus]|uniref:Uncharacterized protein n=1 Tax=Rachicladosporium monterosium TaxID=1507873 RepID=A0ABR0LAI0_9PEZI|nr:hypothetical protein LTR48_002575 [Friedmanniomyces endolithicus]KAK5145980.1 hypothetical protein LTR32_002362 [Rachicladosporium monterosium]
MTALATISCGVADSTHNASGQATPSDFEQVFDYGPHEEPVGSLVTEHSTSKEFCEPHDLVSIQACSQLEILAGLTWLALAPLIPLWDGVTERCATEHARPVRTRIMASVSAPTTHASNTASTNATDAFIKHPGGSSTSAEDTATSCEEALAREREKRKVCPQLDGKFNEQLPKSKKQEDRSYHTAERGSTQNTSKAEFAAKAALFWTTIKAKFWFHKQEQKVDKVEKKVEKKL